MDYIIVARDRLLKFHVAAPDRNLQRKVRPALSLARE